MHSGLLSPSQYADRPDLVGKFKLNLLGSAPAPEKEPERLELARLAETHNLDGLLGEVNFLRAFSAQNLERIAVGESLGRAAAEALEAAGNFSRASVAWVVSAGCALELRGIDEAIALMRLAGRAGRRAGNAGRIDADAGGEAQLHLLRGAYAAALAVLPGPGKERVFSTLARARCAELLGDIEEALEALVEPPGSRLELCM